jgi:hypothetical protein
MECKKKEKELNARLKKISDHEEKLKQLELQVTVKP